MCSGAILLYEIPRGVVGENVNFKGPEQYVRDSGVDVAVVNDPECIRMMKKVRKMGKKGLMRHGLPGVFPGGGPGGFPR